MSGAFSARKARTDSRLMGWVSREKTGTAVIPGRAEREPGIDNHDWGLWIPGLRQVAHPGMTAVAIIGAGPAGLMAAEALAQADAYVTIYDAMSSAGRKLLMAGRGGLNLTHSEALPEFLQR